MPDYKIGIDVGGTNTDCVLVNQANNIIAKVKTPTTQDVSSGIDYALQAVIKNSEVDPKDINYVMLGTTHCTNAIVERKDLNKVGIIRICKPAAQMIPPLSDFPKDLKALIGSESYMIKGGFEFDGRLINALDENEIRQVLDSMKGKVDAIAITGIFSQINPEQEIKVAELVTEILGKEVAISMSHQIGSLGLLERENATILNAMLHRIAVNMTDAFREAIKQNNIDAKLYIGQNDGTLMSLENAKKFPVLTIACGPTNSIRGAGVLSGIKEGIVIDVGGTTSDAGVLMNQFPRESNKAANVGGVQTNFRMPDIVSIGLGGGTIVKSNDDKITVGPQSVGYRILEDSLAFGGANYTLTDYAILDNKITIDKAMDKESLIKSIESSHSDQVQDLQKMIKSIVIDKVNLLIDKVKTDSKPVPVILVGGGSPILPDTIEGVSEILRPDHYEVANAYGACIAQISGEAEKVFNLSAISREDAIQQMKDAAIQNARTAGAKSETIEVLTVNDTPLAYLPNAIKVKVKVCGELA